jgi:hypothetical protein
VRAAREQLLTDPPRASPWWTWAFPAVLLLVSTFAFLGDTGKWNDDWWFFGQRVPETGELRTLGFDRDVHYWRPLYRYVQTPLMAVTFNHDWIVHALCVLGHGLVALAVLRLGRALGLGRVPSVLAALGFMVHPAVHEAALWATALPTPLSTAIMLEVLRSVALRARGVSPPAWWRGPALGLATFAAASLNEQPAALALGGLAVVGAFALARRRDESDRPRERIRAWGLGAWACAGMGAYAAIVLAVFPINVDKGEIGASLPMSVWPARALEMLRAFVEAFTLAEFGTGALAQATRAAGEYPVVAAVWMAALLATAVAWRRHVVRLDPEEGEARSRSAMPLGLIFVVSLALFVVLWLPILRIVYPPFPRLSYAPLAVAALGGGALVELLWRRLGPGGRGVVISSFALFAVVHAAMLAGVQDGYRQRHRADMDFSQTLRRAMPTPPSGAVIVPVRLSDRPVWTGARRFDNQFGGAILWEWSSPHFVRWVYARSDLSAVRGSVLRRPPMRVRPDGTLAMYGRPLPIERVIPIEVGPAGDLVIFTDIVARRADGSEARFELPAPRRIPGVRPRPLILTDPRAGASDE